MSARQHDLNGRRFGRLTVVGLISHCGRMYWHCLCDCGKYKPHRTNTLMTGEVVSCGCFLSELTSSRSWKHGLVGTRIHSAWDGMMERCHNIRGRDYANYGGRGISVCEKWRNVENFLADMGHPPIGLSIDRIDNNRGYEPGNCRWATGKEQSRNRRTNYIIVFNGESGCIAHWSEKTGIKSGVISARIKAGWSVDKTMTTPVAFRSPMRSKSKQSCQH